MCRNRHGCAFTLKCVTRFLFHGLYFPVATWKEQETRWQLSASYNYPQSCQH
jgi:hypothetical protein